MIEHEHYEAKILDNEQTNLQGIVPLLKLPIIQLMTLVTANTSLSISFIDPSLADHLKQVCLSFTDDCRKN
jgi:hypothetical protein